MVFASAVPTLAAAQLDQSDSIADPFPRDSIADPFPRSPGSADMLSSP
jgi:hypothetical protein